MNSPKIALTLAYDGRPFQGWQIQPRALSVQEVVQSALTEVGDANISLVGSGRTDAGVHALGQVAHFSPPPDCRLDLAAWQHALNAKLPPTIRVMKARKVPTTFHAQRSARAKVYRYHLYRGEVLPPHLHGLRWHLFGGSWNGARARQAAELFVGRHDFTAFSANRGKGSDPPDKVRHLFRINVSERGREIAMTFEGEGFLYRMVRFLVGAIVAAGQERMTLSQIQKHLEHPNPQDKSRPQAPPDGLFLMRVRYGARLRASQI